MSGSIFLLAFFVAIATIVLVCTFETYCNDVVVISTICIGTAITLSILVMSTLFTSVKHIQAYLKYDHVVAYDVYKGDMPQIDKEKIIFRNDYTDGRNNPYSYIIVAWNDEDVKNASYDDLIKQH